ncbi:MAG: bifunctional methylenetetrahydrofolate dehydrogenase/methenyltetrahydrofolate cyclohydrolase FolD [Oscillospiraceae bacterium]|nr:bifunctional methylenetetrahydrofolate dehydrogenase/methenyltetrahydrofolate cyclohydrolase FolD [Oscillospiraceae bacterium]
MLSVCKIINGKKIAEKIKSNLKIEVFNIKRDFGVIPGLAIILIGDDPASKIYIKNKQRTCKDIGVSFFKYEFSAGVSEKEVLYLIEKLNQDRNTHGIIVQLPLPKHLNERRIADSVLPEKDVDSFSSKNIGKLSSGFAELLPCTPAGVVELFRCENIEVSGKHAVVIGRSNIVGKPMAMMLLSNDATVTVCHRKSKNIKEICRTADIVISAVGRANFITEDMINVGAVVIDVGINRKDDGKIVGDVDFESVYKKAKFLTPVPGGVGPMTVAMLMKNTVKAAKLLQLRPIFY